MNQKNNFQINRERIKMSEDKLEQNPATGNIITLNVKMAEPIGPIFFVQREDAHLKSHN